jgi:hypothetical protein
MSAAGVHQMMRRTAGVAVVAMLALAGCGGGNDDDDSPQEAKVAKGTPEQVVKDWSEDMRRGDIDAATSRFSVPAIVANGTPQITLDTKQAVRYFNETLPCGSTVTKTERHYGLIIATFRLTDRPGGDCGSGTGNTAKAAFEIRDGKIVKWLRVMDGETPQAPRGDPV